MWVENMTGKIARQLVFTVGGLVPEMLPKSFILFLFSNCIDSLFMVTDMKYESGM